MVSTSLCCQSGADARPFLIKWRRILIFVIVHILCAPCGRICMPLLPCHGNVQGRENEGGACHAWGVNAHPLLGPELFSNCASRTWRLTSGPALEPAELLRKECEGASLKSDEFVVPALGEAVVF